MAASYISVPRDLTKVKSKIMFGLTKRQLICFSVAALFGVPSFFIIKYFTSVNTAVMGMVVVMMPFFFLAMYEKNGQPLEVVMKHMIETVFIRPRVRPYKTDNYYDALSRYAQAKRDVEKRLKDAEDRAEKSKSVKADTEWDVGEKISDEEREALLNKIENAKNSAKEDSAMANSENIVENQEDENVV